MIVIGEIEYQRRLDAAFEANSPDYIHRFYGKNDMLYIIDYIFSTGCSDAISKKYKMRFIGQKIL